MNRNSDYILNHDCFVKSIYEEPYGYILFHRGTTFNIVSETDDELIVEPIDSDFQAMMPKEDFKKSADEIVNTEGYVICFNNNTFWCGNNKTDTDCRNAQIYKSIKNCFEWADKIMDKPVIKNNKFITDYKVRKITVSVNEAIERPNRS